MEGSRAMLRCPVGFIDVTEGSRAMLRCLVRCIDVTEGSRAMLGYPVCYTRPNTAGAQRRHSGGIIATACIAITWIIRLTC
jgi:hypothetical protein